MRPSGTGTGTGGKSRRHEKQCGDCDGEDQFWKCHQYRFHMNMNDTPQDDAAVTILSIRLTAVSDPQTDIYAQQDPSTPTRFNAIAQFNNTAWLDMPASMATALGMSRQLRCE